MARPSRPSRMEAAHHGGPLYRRRPQDAAKVKLSAEASADPGKMGGDGAPDLRQSLAAGTVMPVVVQRVIDLEEAGREPGLSAVIKAEPPQVKGFRPGCPRRSTGSCWPQAGEGDSETHGPAAGVDPADNRPDRLPPTPKQLG